MEPCGQKPEPIYLPSPSHSITVKLRGGSSIYALN